MTENGSDTSKYTDLFLSEAREHLAKMESDLVRFPKEGNNAQVIDDLFRHSHSLKGMSASMGFGAITEIAHATEEIFGLLKKREMDLNPGLTALLVESIEKIHDMIDFIETNRKAPEPVSGHVLALKEAFRARTVNGTQKPAPDKALAQSDSGRTYEIEIDFFKNASLLAARAVLAFKILSGKGSVLHMVPDLEQIRAGSFEGRLVIRAKVNLNQEALENIVRSIAEVERFKIIPLPQGQAWLEATDDTVLPPSVRVKTGNLDDFFDDLVELMIQHERLTKMLANADIGRARSEAEKIDGTIKNLHTELIKMRMLPFSYISRRFEKSVRQLAQELNKKVALKIIGGETEMDKSMLEEISDPINHVIRNSIDHGIETPSVRKNLGKNESGLISISLMRKSDSVIITLEDDGSGIDLEKVKRMALEEHYITEEEYHSLSTADAYMLVTVPGFSTLTKATAISGRGVGLDAVRTKIENLGGKMRIGPRIGGGSVVEFFLPLTIAIINAFIIREKNSLFAIPVSCVERTTGIVPSDVVHEGDAMIVAKNGMAINVFELTALLTEPDGRGKLESPKHLMIFRDEDKMVGLAVEEIMYRKNIVVKPLLFPLDQLRKYTGASLLEDGKIALILDVFNMMGV